MERDGDLIHRELAFMVIGAAMEVHRELGPGFLESIYQSALEKELRLRGIPFESQKPVVVTYKDDPVGTHVLDLVVDGRIIVELKAASDLAPIHEAQLLSYLKATKFELGLLVNFGRSSLQSKRLAFSPKSSFRKTK